MNTHATIKLKYDFSAPKALVSNTRLSSSSDVIPFPKSFKKRWTCNVSEQFRFAKRQSHYLQISSTHHYSQFDIICRLLRAGTCDVIYFDQQFNIEELQVIRSLQALTQTSLINAKQAFLFTNTSYGTA